MPHAQINGTDLFYRSVGTGWPCFILHGGLGIDHTYLHPWLDPLGDQLQRLPHGYTIGCNRNGFRNCCRSFFARRGEK